MLDFITTNDGMNETRRKRWKIENPEGWESVRSSPIMIRIILNIFSLIQQWTLIKRNKNGRDS